MSEQDPYAEYEAARRHLLLASIKLRGPIEESVTDYDTALNRLQKSYDHNDQLTAALKWAHGFISNTDKQAADRLLELSGMDRGYDYGKKWGDRY